MINTNETEYFSDPLKTLLNRRLLSYYRSRLCNSVISELKILLDGMWNNSHTIARVFTTEKIHQIKEMAPDQSH